MKKGKVFGFLKNIKKLISRPQIRLILTLFIIQFLFANSVQAILETNATISNQGTLIYPTNPSENLVIIPDSFMDDINGAASSYAFVDYSVTLNGSPSIRLEADYVRGTREVNCIYSSIKPGDHIVWKVWCKTSSDVQNTDYTGARVGVDLQVRLSNRLSTCDAQPHDYTTSIDDQLRSGTLPSWHYTGTQPEMYLGYPLVSQFKLPFGNDWTLLYLDFVVPDTRYITDLFGLTDYGGAYQISSCGPWIDARELTDGTVWFANSEFYINP